MRFVILNPFFHTPHEKCEYILILHMKNVNLYILILEAILYAKTFNERFNKMEEKNTQKTFNYSWCQTGRKNLDYETINALLDYYSNDFELAIQWLMDCGLILKSTRISKPGMPLIAYMEMNTFKIYMLDVGLLAAMYNLDARVLLEGNKVFEEFKEALTEQFVAQQLIFDTVDIQLATWSSYGFFHRLLSTDNQ